MALFQPEPPCCLLPTQAVLQTTYCSHKTSIKNSQSHSNKHNGIGPKWSISYLSYAVYLWNSLCIKDLVNDVNNAAYVGNSLGFETEPICLESLLVKK